MNESRWLVIDQQDALKNAKGVVEKLLPVLLHEVDHELLVAATALTSVAGCVQESFSGHVLCSFLFLIERSLI